MGGHVVHGRSPPLGKTLEAVPYSTKVVQIIKCTCTVFIDNFRNISTNSSI